ncbi:hypothetical protein GMO_15020 [Gluconobacter morbifer G707]|uniref:Uncharacterized protein n=1 Tax=Gluconobacter morbifer G707 TaxID=1088869 RepID=G6XJ36_9PROT|nr:hypothetical protein GMO_15020 [Gluconobacter morbifer G707]
MTSTEQDVRPCLITEKHLLAALIGCIERCKKVLLEIVSRNSLSPGA